MKINYEMDGESYNWTDKKYGAKVKNTSNNLRQNLGGLFSVLAFSITVFFNGCSSRVISEKIQ
jgi:hypothetical protein